MNKFKETITDRLIANTTVYDCKIAVPKVYSYLNHNPTKTSITCYKPIGWFKRMMLNWCFGLKYKKSNG